MTPSNATRPIFLGENGFFIGLHQRKLILALGLAYALTLFFAPSARADSRSKTVTVSCVIPAVMEISTAFTQGAPVFSSPSPAPKDQISLKAENASVTAGGNMNGKFRLNRDARANGVVYTVTAL
ncbi:MAG TPA: hypothetical protein VL404_07505 [Candidatus Eisenbacteria bacterium]|nr:hypothetical protein [Candidatus Eisenbacteria bacterium]